jgi:hypothetical protein
MAERTAARSLVTMLGFLVVLFLSSALALPRRALRAAGGPQILMLIDEWRTTVGPLLALALLGILTDVGSTLPSSGSEGLTPGHRRQDSGERLNALVRNVGAVWTPDAPPARRSPGTSPSA